MILNSRASPRKTCPTSVREYPNSNSTMVSALAQVSGFDSTIGIDESSSSIANPEKEETTELVSDHC